ncbi:MAG TPA: hypothetical protein VHC69_25415 [Polyangiaceae bacterium]|nr:hypothetical protein [Polyangiaceae bacterium]
MKSSDLTASAATLAVRFPPIWTHIQPLAVYVGAVLEMKGRSDSADRVAIVANELIENAVKYGDPASEVTFELFVDAGLGIVVRVTNKAHPSRVAILERELKRNTTTNPREAFARALERLQHLPEGSTMLGLARVTLEAELSVETAANVVIATARMDTGGGRASVPFAKNAPREAARTDMEAESQRQQREPVASVSQTRRAVGPLGRTGISSSSVRAVGDADGGPKRR